MFDLTESQLQTFFKQFSKFTQQADEHWPLAKEKKKKYENTPIGYGFVSVITNEDFHHHNNTTLINSFFALYNDQESVFSTGSQFLDEAEIRKGIATQHDLDSAVTGKRDRCPFLLLGYDKLDSGRTLVGLVGHYFPTSKSIFIQTIVTSPHLLGTSRQTNMGVLGNPTEMDRENLLKYETSQLMVLGWMLTYRNNQEREGKAGLYHLVDRIEILSKLKIIGKNTKIPSDNVLAVFHEALNPALAFEGKEYLTCEENTQILSQQKAATKALRAFHSAQARFIRFAYRCPSNEGWTINENRKYFLLTFPQAPPTPNYLTLSTSIVMAFIVDHFCDVNQKYDTFREDIQSCWDFEPGIEAPIKGIFDNFGKNSIVENARSLFANRFTPYATDIYLHSVPQVEQPRFSFRRASIGFEIIVDEDYFEPRGLEPYHFTILPPISSTRLVKGWRKVKNWITREDVVASTPLYCPVGHSVETDLFAYKYQSEPPYFTRYYGLRTSKITVEFPSNFEFTSEGRAETFFVLPERPESHSRFEDTHPSGDSPFPYFGYSIKMNACVSYTYFLNSAVRVWHLVLKPDEESLKGINELEIIKLMKFFSGAQEHKNEEHRQNLVRRIKFSVDREGGEQDLVSVQNPEPDNLIKLLYDLTNIVYVNRGKRAKFRPMERGDEVVTLRNVRSGVIEIDTGDMIPKPSFKSNIDSESNFLGFYENVNAPELNVDQKNKIRTKVKDLYKNLHNDDIQMGDESVAFSVDEYANYVFKSFCGICLGIFDYGRMGLQEVDDTLVPLPDSKTEESFLVIHRGVLAMLGYGDDVMETFWNTLGINAYLLIPSAVLAHNDFVSRDAERRLNRMLEDLRFDKTDPSISKLLSERNFIDDLLNDDLLGNVFQYKTEQELYKEGMERRGIAERIRDGRSKLDQLDKLIITRQDERRNRAQKFIQVILSLLSLVSLYTPLRDIYVDEIGYKYEYKEASGNSLMAADRVQVYGDKQAVKVDWSKLSFKKGVSVKEWLFPSNALDAAHHQILVVLVIVFLYSVITLLTAPGAMLQRMWQRRYNNRRRLPGNRGK